MIKPRFLNSDQGAGLILILPSLLILLVFVAIPLVSALLLSFAKWDLVPNSIPSFIGFKNYITLFFDEYFYKCLINTFLISVIAVPVSVLTALVLSILLSQPKYIKGDWNPKSSCMAGQPDMGYSLAGHHRYMAVGG